jgi:PAS domain S-box-containing protein
MTREKPRKGFWRGLAGSVAGLSFFAAKSERDFFLLAVTGGVFILPFAFVNYVERRPLMGTIATLLAAWFLLNGIMIFRGRRLVPAAAIFLPTPAVIAYALYIRADYAIYWIYPAILLFHFILPRWVANLYNLSLLAMSVPFTWSLLGPDVAVRAGATIFLTIVFANVFSFLTERQRRREEAQELEVQTEHDRLALLVHATRAGFTDWDAHADPDGLRIVYSDRLKEILGYPADADTAEWPHFFERMHAEDRPRVEAEFLAMLRQKRKPGLQPPGQALDYRLRRADGSYVWVHAESLAQVDESMRIRRFITSYQDISAFRAQEERLTDQAKFAADVFDSLPVGLAMRDLEGRYIFVNRAWESFTGARREDVIGKTVHDRAPKDEADAVTAADRAALARGVGETSPMQDFAFRDRRYVLTRTVIPNAEGKPRGVLAASVDMTERFAIQEALAAEQRRFELVVRASNTGILDWDGVTRTVYYSGRLKEILGYPAQSDESAMPDYWELVHPEDRPRVEKRFREHLEARDEQLHGTIQYRLRRRDGSYVWIEAFGASVRDEKGFARRFIASITDISERRAQEEALATERARLDLVVSAQKVGIVDWDGRTHATYYSPRFKEILGHPPDADTSDWPDYFKVLIHPDDRERVIKRWRTFIIGRGPEGPRGEYYAPEEYRLLRADGSYVWVQVGGVAVRDDKGFVTRWIASTTDITERRKQEEALRESVRLREEVERMSRHDLKTPLNSVIAMSRLLRESSHLSPDDAELLGSVERAGYRILNMVNLSLDLFRMESGTYRFNPQAVDLGGVARRVAADLENQAASKAIFIRVSPEKPMMVRAEELLCYSMFANLVKNAIEAAPVGETVSVTLDRQGDWVVAEVYNPGAVPEAVRERFFQKYATAGKAAGLGLGAYSARLMARVQEGDIMLQSTGAAGTSIVVRLKAALGNEARVPAEGDERAVAFQAAREALPPLKVLVVDDDEFNRLVFRRTLPTPPLTLSMAVNGRAAIELAEREWPDAVLLDLEMPVMDGYEAARRLREMEKKGDRKRCKIIAVSSNDEREIIERAIAAGCDDYLVKPAPRETLWQMLAGTGSVFSISSFLDKDKETASRTDAVLLDPELHSSLPAFLDSRRKALVEAAGALGAGDRPRFRRVAHRLAGSFALYGFAWAALECQRLEREALAGNADDLARRAAALRDYLDEVEIRVRPASAYIGAGGAS